MIQPTDKYSLRSLQLKKRMAIATCDHSEWSRMACDNISAFVTSLACSATVIAGYVPIHNELDITYFSCNALPVIELQEKSLRFRAFAKGDVLIKGLYGTEEPVSSSPYVTPDMILAPLVAFDRSGQRLGYGKGYYDATLYGLRARVSSLIVVGVAFSLQEEVQLPACAHDERLDWIITENEVIPCR